MIYRQPGNHESSQKVFPVRKDALYLLQKNDRLIHRRHSTLQAIGFSFSIFIGIRPR